MPVRNVRYLIAEGFVDPPRTDDGGKANASYGEGHLAQLRVYQHLRDAGLSQREIRKRIEGRSADEIMKGIDEVVRRLAPGLELKVTASLIPPDLDVGDIISRVRGILEVFKHGHRTKPRKGKHNADAAAEDH